MESLKTLALILTPMFVGFFICLKPEHIRVLDRLLNALVYVILALIGIGLARESNLLARIDDIAAYTALLFTLLMACNLTALIAFDRLKPWKKAQAAKGGKRTISISGSLKQLAVVLAGLAAGLVLPTGWLPPADSGTYVLMLLIFIVGIQLRSSGIGLKQVLLDKRGLQTSVVFMLSCLAAGVLFALLVPAVPLTQGLAMSSGYGWYSLSGIVMTQAYGAAWGSVALLNDLLREFFALAFIPVLMRRHPCAAVGIGGATSLDFTLPVIQSAGGLAVVPLAISFGFVVNVVSPFLMVLFSALR